ncbi:MAG: sulfotransferase domain-containing protein, partial [Candidatus Sericytochromatia bacterium]
MRIKPLVVGAPRSGFSLLIHVINSILTQVEIQLRQVHGKQLNAETYNRDQIVRPLIDFFSFYLTEQYKQTFTRFGIIEQLVFNGEFHLLVGGPKWLDKKHPGRACFRKYMGAKGYGDFLLITSHPQQVLEYYPTLHSHLEPARWLNDPYYKDFLKFTSVRNPIGIINSSCFSLNAMASEYVQRFMPGEDETAIRQRQALYKLTDMDFVMGLIKYLRGYLDEYLPVRDGYHLMKWEDLISHPGPTIQTIARQLGIEISEDSGRAVWAPMDHKNLLIYHQHNYRRGKGIVGDWKKSLVQEHMELFRECGFEDYLRELGYPPIPTLDPRDYSPYQKLVARHIRRGEIFRNTGDPDLFGFAFNKTNIDASKFNFKSYPPRNWTHVERTTFSDDKAVEA